MSAAATSVVERMLGHAAAADWDALRPLLSEDFVIREPASLPYGGEHHGHAGYVALMQHIGSLFELEFRPEGLHELGGSRVLLAMQVTFTARATGIATLQPVLELLTVRDGRIAESNVYIHDNTALLIALAKQPSP